MIGNITLKELRDLYKIEVDDLPKKDEVKFLPDHVMGSGNLLHYAYKHHHDELKNNTIMWCATDWALKVVDSFVTELFHFNDYEERTRIVKEGLRRFYQTDGSRIGFVICSNIDDSRSTENILRSMVENPSLDVFDIITKTEKQVREKK